MDKAIDGTDKRVDARPQGSAKNSQQDQTLDASQSTSTTFSFEEALLTSAADSFGSCSSLASSVASSSATALLPHATDYTDSADVWNRAELDVVSDEATPGRFVQVVRDDLMNLFNSPTKKRKYAKTFDDICSSSFDTKRLQTYESGSDEVTQFPASSFRSTFSPVPSTDHQIGVNSAQDSVLLQPNGFVDLNSANCGAVDLSRTANYLFSANSFWNRRAVNLQTNSERPNKAVDLTLCKESSESSSILDRTPTGQSLSNRSLRSLVDDIQYSFALNSSFPEKSKFFTALENRGRVMNNESASPSGVQTVQDASTENSSDPSETSLMASSDAESEEREVARLQAVLEARGLPSQFLGSFTSRMNQLSERAVTTAATGKQIQDLMQQLETSTDDGEILATLIELCQLLVMGNEESLSGFPIRQAVPVLTRFLLMDHNFDIMNQACRALTYLLEGLPRSSQTVAEAVPILLEKLQSIECMDVAEQSLRALELLSRKHSKAILQRNGVATSLMFIDFFSITAQRSALAITANCCLSMTVEEFCFIQESLPLITSRLMNQDKKLVESACQCLARLVDNCQTEERILKEIAVHGLLTDVQQLLFVTPPVISTSMLVTVLHMLVVMCFNCPDLAIILLKLNVSETISYLLIGTSEKGRTGGPPELIPRSPQELFEIVSLVGELMPMLPNEGLFAVDALLGNTSSLTKQTGVWQWKDNNEVWHSYNAIDNRIIEMAHQSGEIVVSLTSMGRAYVIDFNTMQQMNEDAGTTRQIQRKVSSTGAKPDATSVKGDSRAVVLYENSELANGLTSTLFAVLFEVYCSSAALFVRHKCLRTLLRMLFYGSAELLSGVLQMVPLSSHLAAMLSSNDLQTIVSSIQICNILMTKLPEVFSIYFRRQGVLHQMNKLIQSSAIDLSAKKKASPTVPMQSTSVNQGDTSPLSAAATAAAVSVQLGAGAEKPTKETTKPSSPGTQLRLSDVLKRKKPIRKSPKKTGKSDDDNTESSPSSTVASNAEGSSRSLPGSSHGRLFGARDSRIGSLTPKSFLASLNPTRWGRSNQSASERPVVTRTPLNKSTSDLGHQTVNNRELIKQWISDQASKFIKKFFDGDVEGLGHPSLAVFKRLCSSASLVGQDSQMDVTYLPQVADILVLNDVSPFEVIQSGLIKKLLSYFTSTSIDSETMDAHLKTFVQIFIGQPKSKTEWSSGQWEILSPPPLLHLVNKLMACFHHLEQFQIKVHDLRETSNGQGLQVAQFFHAQQIKCNLQLHPNCKVSMKLWKGGTISVDPFASLYSIERYIILKGFGRMMKNSSESEDDDDDDDVNEGDDDEEEDDDDDMEDGEIDDALTNTSSLSGLNKHVIEFLIGDRVVPYNMTVYQAVKQFACATECNNATVESPRTIEESAIWTQNHTIWYRPLSSTAENQQQDSPETEKQKSESVSSPSSQSTTEQFIYAESLNLNRLHILKSFLVSVLPNTMTFDDPALEVLSLLRILHALNSQWTSVFDMECCPVEPAISRQEFVSNKLTAKVNRQLQEPAIVTTCRLPQWLIQLANLCPFLLPFENRLLLFCATSFDRDRAVQRIQDLTRESVTMENGERHATGRLERKKKIISRDEILKQAETAVGELVGSKAILEIQYENEVGSGLGPTLEFYALVSQELQRADLDLWRGEKRQLQTKVNDCSEEQQQYVYSPTGLFPAPIPQNLKSQSLRRIKSKFSFLGKFMARALIDSRILDLPLSILFYKWLLGKESTLSISDLHFVDPDLFSSISKLQQLLREKKRIETDAKFSSDLRKSLLEKLTLDGCSVEDLGLDFTLPGYPTIDLKKGGKDISVTIDNLEEYVQLVVKWSLVYGVQHQFEAVREGFESVLPLQSLGLFFPEEMDQLFCGNQQEQWSFKYLTEVCLTDHGYTHDSQAVKHLFSILSSYGRDDQRLFLQFVTGSPRLPVGGLKSLNPPLTIVRKTDSRDYADDFLPSVMTCVNYLKLPDYSSIEVMRNKLAIALREGQLSFHLS